MNGLGNDRSNEAMEVSARLANLENAVRRIPSRWVGNAAEIPALYLVIGGNTLAAWAVNGISKRTDAVAGSEMPNPGGGSGVVLVTATNPAPAGLPNGVGVGRNLTTNSYEFLLLDSNSPLAVDLAADDVCPAAGTITLDLVAGAVTYRYACRIALARL